MCGITNSEDHRLDHQMSLPVKENCLTSNQFVHVNLSISQPIKVFNCIYGIRLIHEQDDRQFWSIAINLQKIIKLPNMYSNMELVNCYSI